MRKFVISCLMTFKMQFSYRLGVFLLECVELFSLRQRMRSWHLHGCWRMKGWLGVKMALALGNLWSSSEEGTSLKYSKIYTGAGADRTRRGPRREPGQTRKGWRTGKEIGFHLQVTGSHGCVCRRRATSPTLCFEGSVCWHWSVAGRAGVKAKTPSTAVEVVNRKEQCQRRC